MSVPAERRRYRRHSTKLPGSLDAGGGQHAACVVHDYCSGGMLIQQMHPESDRPLVLAVGQPVQLKTVLRIPDGSRRVHLDATVAWTNGDFLGIAFAQVSDSVVQALGQHDRLARAAGPAEPSARSGDQARYLARLRQVAKGRLPVILREILVKTVQDLLDKADEVGSNTDQQQLFGDVNALESRRRDDELMRRLLTVALDGGSEPVEKAEPPASELSLVDPDDFERWLEASRVATLLDRRFSEPLSALASRLAAARGDALPGTLTVPFEPQQFTRVLKDLAAEMEFGLISRGVLFDRAAMVLEEQLGDFYTELDEALDNAGAPAAEENRKVALLRPAGHPQRATQRPGEGVQEGVVDSGENGPERAVTGGGFAAAGGAIDPHLLQNLLAREVEERQSQAQELLSYIADAPQVNETLAAWLQQLGEPLVREAAADQTFFQNTQHPMRAIVDSLGHLQMFRPARVPDPAEDPIGQRVSELLQSIGSDDIDPAALRAIADEVAQLTGQQSQQYQRNVERVVAASEGRDRVRQAHLAVVAEINQRYAGRWVPELVPEVLDVGWRAVLELAWLRSAEGGGGYTAQLGVLDALVAKLGGEARDHEAADIDAQWLLQALEKELAVVAFDPFRRNAVETRLRDALQRPDQAALVRMQPLAEDHNNGRPARPEGIDQQAWNDALQHCASISVGDRLLSQETAEGQDELGVAWVRDDHGQFVLVDHRGLRARDLDLAELAAGLHSATFSVVTSDGRPLSERAVDSILARMEERLSQQAAQDSQTGLINRQQFQIALEQAAGLPGRPDGVLLWLDIDQFRLVNDIHGYATGDRLLVAVARLLQQIKGAKVPGHLGGDRFAVLLADSDLADGERRAEEICTAVREMPFDWQGQAISLSVSVGVVGLEVAAEGFGAALQAGDNALAAAKAVGGDGVFVYHDDDPDIARRKESVQWLVQVDDALEHGRLKLRCQPIVPVRPVDGMSPHYEVLLGVSSGTEQPLPIAEFIDAAERYNRMRAVDRWVTRTVMEWIAAHREHMPKLHNFAVNLSGQTASDPGFLDFVRKQFQRTGIEPAWLSFEVTETAAVSDLSSTAGIIRDIKALGCKVALDDFGSGLASYSYLKEFPVDWLKIDGVFVRKIAASREDYAVVKSINEIGHFLGKKTIGEYVADDDILRCVGEIGVDFAQGFGISPPILMDQVLSETSAA